jgi:3-oxoacyl-[acyl-carrier-protein] synthase II
MARDVVVTGMGVLAAGETDAGAFWARVAGGVSAVAPVTLSDPEGPGCRIGAELPGFSPASFLPRNAWRRLDRSARLALCAAAAAWEDSRIGAGMPDAGRIGVFEGTSLGPLAATLRAHRQYLAAGCRGVGPATMLAGMTGSASGAIAMQLRLHGPCLTVSDGSTSSANAIGLALRAVRSGHIDAAIAGGAESPFAEEIFATFASTGVLSAGNGDPPGAMKPFDRRRDGFVLGEGACFLVLEELTRAERRGATILATLAGYGEATDAYHPTSPDPEGTYLARAMTAALHDAGARPESIGYVNAHGTATAANDPVECRALRLVFGDPARTPAVSSTKPVTGHLLGGCGAVEAAVAILALQHGFVPPTINLAECESGCDLDFVPRTGRPQPMLRAMTNNLSFGGRNTSLLFERHD